MGMAATAAFAVTAVAAIKNRGVDLFGAAFFAIHATDMVWKQDFGLPVAPVILGVITAIGGGLMRDVLAGRPTLLMSRELYAVPLLFACTLFVLILAYAPEYRAAGVAGCVGLSFLLRSAAIHWNLRMPRWLLSKP